jgi:hypothetical protein
MPKCDNKSPDEDDGPTSEEARAAARQAIIDRLKEVTTIYEVEAEQFGQSDTGLKPWLPAAHLTGQQVAEAMAESLGHLGKTARLLGISRDTLWRRMRAEPKLKGFHQSLVEELTDDVEAQLISQALAGEPWAVRFWMISRAKHRGYARQVQIDTGNEDEDAARAARLASSKIDLSKLTPEQIEVLAQIAEEHERRVLGDDGR